MNAEKPTEIYQVIKMVQEDRGITTAELSRRAGIEYQALNNALKGRRNIRGNELVCLCRELEINMDEFYDIVGEAPGNKSLQRSVNQ